MAVKTKAQILAEIASLLADNTTGDISASDIRTCLNDITDSYFDAPYKKYVALFSQSSLDAPTATILENTLSGTPTLSYSSAGVYYITLTGEFLAGKVFCLSPQQLPIQGANVFSTFVGRDTDDRCYIKTFSGTGVANDVLDSTAIEIRVYE